MSKKKSIGVCTQVIGVFTALQGSVRLGKMIIQFSLVAVAAIVIRGLL